jgi:hypothetical protein
MGKIGPSGAADNAPRIDDVVCDAGADLCRCPAGLALSPVNSMGKSEVADHSPQPQPLLASGWQSGCGQRVMIFGIGLMTLSGLCTMGMTIADLSDSGHHGGDIDLRAVFNTSSARRSS